MSRIRSLSNAIASLNGTTPNRSAQQFLQQPSAAPAATETSRQTRARKILTDAGQTNESDVIRRLREQDAAAASLKATRDTSPMDMVDDPWSGSYTSPAVDGLDDIDIANLQARINSDANRSGEAVVNKGQSSFGTPVEQLSPMELSARAATQRIIQNKLTQLGLASLAVGGTAALIDGQQAEDTGNLLVNPVTGAVVSAGVAGGLGGTIGALRGDVRESYYTPEVLSQMDKQYGGEGSYARDAAFDKRYAPKHNQKIRSNRIRGSLKGAGIGVGGAALLNLIGALKQDEPSQQQLY